MSEGLTLGDIIKEFQSIYKKLLDMLITAYSYSPHTLLIDLDSYIRSHADIDDLCKRELEGKGYETNFQKARAVLDFCRHETLPYIVRALDSLIEINQKIDKGKIVDIINLFAHPIEEITKHVVNGWFVETSRRIGKLSPYLFDNYNLFKEKWNSALNDIERVARMFGLNISIGIRAKELGVQVQP